MRNPLTAPGLRSRVSFARPDAEILLYNVDAESMPPVWPAMQLREVDEELQRQHGGVPISEGHAHYLLPLGAEAVAAGFARVTDLRTRQVLEYDVVQVDDDPRRWTILLTLVQRQLPIGIS